MFDVKSQFANAKRANAALNRREYHDGRVELRSLPRALFVELTQGCNLRCPMCRTDLIPTRGNSMPSELFAAIAAELFPTAELVDLRGWGESLILPDILSQIEQVARYGAKLRIVTNLSFSRREVLDALVSVNADVAISLDSADPGVLAEVRRGANLDTISQNINYLRSAFGHTRNLSLLVAVQRPALHTLPELMVYASEHRISTVTLFAVTAEDVSDLAIGCCGTLVDEVVAATASLAHTCGVRLIAGTKLGSLPENRADFPTCIHPWAYAYVSYRGDVSFCDHLIGPANREYIVGSLADTDFSAIWNGEAMRKIRTEHLRKRDPRAQQFAHCAWCYKNKYVDFEDEFEPAFASERIQLCQFKPGA